MSQPTNALNYLPTLPSMTWRGIVSPPYDMANPSGGHTQAERRFPYIDGASHDNVGRDPFQMQFRLYFLNSLRDGLFPDLYEEWKGGFILNGSSGDLEHPLFGTVRSRPMSWTIDLNATRTSGLVMDVVFVETFDEEPPDVPTTALLMSLTEVATAADKAMAALGIPWPTGERTTSLSDLLKQVQSAAFSARLTFQGMVNQALGTIDRIISDVQKLEDHAKWALEFNLKELFLRVKDLGVQAAQSTRRTLVRVMQNETGLDALANGNNSVEDVIALNPGLVTSPTVTAGTAVTLFAE